MSLFFIFFYLFKKPLSESLPLAVRIAWRGIYHN